MTIKKQVISAFIAIQEQTIANLKNAVDEAQQMANEYGPPKDRYDSFRTQQLSKRDLFAKQLQKAIDDLNILKKINTKEKKTSVEFGALVITNQQNFLVATGIGKVTLENTTYMCISTSVPIFQVLKNKKIADEISFNNNIIKILEIY